MGPLRGMPETTAAFSFSSLSHSPYWFSLPEVVVSSLPGTRTQGQGWDLLLLQEEPAAEISLPPIFNHHVSVGPALFAPLPL